MITFKKDPLTGKMSGFRPTDVSHREREQRRQLEAFGEVADQIRGSEEVKGDWEDLFRFAGEHEEEDMSENSYDSEDLSSSMHEEDSEEDSSRPLSVGDMATDPSEDQRI